MKRTYDWGQIVFAVFLGIFLMAIIVAALGYGPKGKALPLLTAAFTLLMIITTILSEFNPKIKKRLNIGLIDFEKFGTSKKGDSPSTKAGALEHWKKLLGASGWTVGALFAIYLVGFHIAISLFGVLFLRFHGGVKWLMAVVLTAILYGSVYLFFDVLLAVELYEGIFFGAVPPSF